MTYYPINEQLYYILDEKKKKKKKKKNKRMVILFEISRKMSILESNQITKWFNIAYMGSLT